MVTRSQMTQFVLLVFVMGLLVTCGPTPTTTTVGPISVQPNTITVGEKAILKVEVAGTNLRFEWKARRGKIENPTGAAPTYTAPDTPGSDSVTLTVTGSGGDVVKTIDIEVVDRVPVAAAVPTPTPPPASTAPAATSMPPASTAAATALPVSPVSAPTVLATTAPAPSNIPPLLDIFPQGIDGEDWSWSNAPGSLTTQFVEDGNCHLSGLYGLRLVYSFTDNGNGGWGVHWANTPTKHFTATQFTAFTFSVRGTAPNGFQIGLKDTTGFEVKLESNPFVLANDSVWKPVTIPLNRFARQGKQVNIASVENINFGFHKGHGSGNICIDDIAFQ